MVFFFFFFFFFEVFFYEVLETGLEWWMGRKEGRKGRKEKKGGGMVALLSRHNKSEVK